MAAIDLTDELSESESEIFEKSKKPFFNETSSVTSKTKPEPNKSKSSSFKYVPFLTNSGSLPPTITSNSRNSSSSINDSTKKEIFERECLKLQKIDAELVEVYEKINLFEQQKKILEEKRREIIKTLEQTTSNLDKNKRKFVEEITNFSSSFLPEENNKKKMKVSSLPINNPEHWRKEFEWSQKLDELKTSAFGISSFRENQLEVINCALSGNDVFCIMPTGGGKSLCYQLPALLQKGITIVISPLVSLMQDQVMTLNELSIDARTLLSTTPKGEQTETLNALTNLNSPLKLLYITPEKLAKSNRLKNKIEIAHKHRRLTRIIIDEAHCCSQWGHDFRTDYKALSYFKKQFPTLPIMALTATATNRVVQDVKEILGIRNCYLFKTGLNRPNLYYEVRPKVGNVVQNIVDFIKESHSQDSGIIYCLSKNDAETLTEKLKKFGLSVSAYHAGLLAKEREYVHHQWFRGKIKIIVGTIAFGLGINKPDVRFVIHHSLSKSLEGYYQESGRAGRDGKPAYCLLYYSCHDLARLSCMVWSDQNCPLENLYSIAEYCEEQKLCRRKLIFDYFNETFSQEGTECCDNCSAKSNGTNKGKLENITPLAKDVLCILDDIQNRGERVTLLQLVDIWRGIGKRKVDAIFTPAKDLKKEKCEHILIHLIIHQVLKEEFSTTPYTTISYIGKGTNAHLVFNGSLILQKFFANVSERKTKFPFQTSPLEDKIKEAVNDLARTYNCSPQSILDSKKIAEICEKRPQTIQEMEAFVPNLAVLNFGEELMRLILSLYEAYPPKELEVNQEEDKAGSFYDFTKDEEITKESNSKKMKKKKQKQGQLSNSKEKSGPKNSTRNNLPVSKKSKKTYQEKSSKTEKHPFDESTDEELLIKPSPNIKIINKENSKKQIEDIFDQGRGLFDFNSVSHKSKQKLTDLQLDEESDFEQEVKQKAKKTKFQSSIKQPDEFEEEVLNLNSQLDKLEKDNEEMIELKQEEFETTRGYLSEEDKKKIQEKNSTRKKSLSLNQTNLKEESDEFDSS